jgi:carboxyl-terminal processing protease
VLDGAGIDPDIRTNSAVQSEFMKELVKEKMIFYFANKYYFDNQNTKPKENFTLENKTMNEFEGWLKTQKFVYETADQKAIEALIKSSKESGDYAKMKTNLDDLRKVADSNTQGMVKKNWEQIKEALELEILSRYYYQKAMKFVAFEKDKDIQEALKLFGNPQKYKSILAGK